jgi:hypothetical protein
MLAAALKPGRPVTHEQVRRRQAERVTARRPRWHPPTAA